MLIHLGTTMLDEESSILNSALIIEKSI